MTLPRGLARRRQAGLRPLSQSIWAISAVFRRSTSFTHVNSNCAATSPLRFRTNQRGDLSEAPTMSARQFPGGASTASNRGAETGNSPESFECDNVREALPHFCLPGEHLHIALNHHTPPPKSTCLRTPPLVSKPRSGSTRECKPRDIPVIPRNLFTRETKNGITRRCILVNIKTIQR